MSPMGANKLPMSSKMPPRMPNEAKKGVHFIKNASNFAGLGLGGEGFTSFTIASPTGEGLTTARDFTRVRRCTLAGYFRIV